MIETNTGVKAVIFYHSEFLALVKPDGILDLPGGRVEVGEKEKEALYREIREETGLAVNIHNSIYKWSFIKSSGLLITGTTYSCGYLGGQIMLSDEHTGYLWLSLNQIVHPDFSIWLNNQRKTELINNEGPCFIPAEFSSRRSITIFS